MDREARRQEIQEDAGYWMDAAEEILQRKRFYNGLEERSMKHAWAREMMRSHDARRLVEELSRLVGVLGEKR